MNVVQKLANALEHVPGLDDTVRQLLLTYLQTYGRVVGLKVWNVPPDKFAWQWSYPGDYDPTQHFGIAMVNPATMGLVSPFSAIMLPAKFPPLQYLNPPGCVILCADVACTKEWLGVSAAFNLMDVCAEHTFLRSVDEYNRMRNTTPQATPPAIQQATLSAVLGSTLFSRLTTSLRKEGSVTQSCLADILNIVQQYERILPPLSKIEKNERVGCLVSYANYTTNHSTK